MSDLSREASIVAEECELMSRRRRDAMLMAVISFFVVLHRRWSGEPAGVVGSEAAAVMGLFALAFLVELWNPIATRVKPHVRRLIAIALVAIALCVPTASRLILNMMGEYGPAWEMVMLTTLGIGAMSLVFISPKQRNASLSVVCSGFLTLFSTSISDSNSAVLFAILWVLICLYWMVANHWERLEVHLAQTVRHHRSLRFGTSFAGVAVCLLAGLVMWGREPATRLIQWGIMPTSGGSRWTDPSARHGVGDGDAVVAAKDHASSFGPVESELFLQSDLPSLFDMFDDTIGEVAMKRKSEKAMALVNLAPQGEEQKLAQSQQGNASFSTSREAVEKERKLRDKNSPAILHWIGPSGISLAMERFDRFDGVDWTQSVKDSVVSHLLSNDLVRREWDDEKGKQVWYFRKRNQPSPLLGEVRSDAVKFINLESARIPTAPESEAVHIADIDRDDFFAISGDRCWYMPGRQSIPSLTVVRLVTRTIDGDALAAATFPTTAPDAETKLLHGPKTEGVVLAQQLADTWTAEVPHGWQEVCAVIDRLRSEFTFDRSTSLNTDDPLLDFLNQKSGGDHLFATAAASMLAHRGYQVRLTTGFYCDPEDEDPFAGHTEIGAEDAHVWLEVCAGNDVWIPLEPTPGYAVPRFHRTIWNRMIAFAWFALPWGIFTVFAGSFLWWTRAWWGEAVCRVVWLLSRPFGDRARMNVLIRLLEWRGRLAGRRRPIGVTPRSFYVEIASRSDEATSRATSNFFDTADAFFYSPVVRLDKTWVNDADRVAKQLTVRKMNRNKMLSGHEV